MTSDVFRNMKEIHHSDSAQLVHVLVHSTMKPRLSGKIGCRSLIRSSEIFRYFERTYVRLFFSTFLRKLSREKNSIFALRAKTQSHFSPKT